MADDALELTVDDGILLALVAAANRMQAYYEEEETPVIVTKAVVVFQYVDATGESVWAYRRVKADWFEVGGAAELLRAAGQAAWTAENDA